MPTNVTDYGSILLDNMRFEVIGAMTDEDIVNIQGRKVTQGDPGPDDHPINSSWIQSDWSGGGQIKVGKPDTVSGRFYFATSDTMQSRSITLPPSPDSWDDPTASGNASMMLGTYNDKVWAAWGNDVRFYNAGANTWDAIAGGLLTSTPLYKGKVFKPSSGALAGSPVFCIPLGSSFDYINGSSITNVAKSCVDLVVDALRLWRLGQDGSMSYTTDLINWSVPIYIPDDSDPRHINNYLTVSGEPTPFITTNQSVWAYDELANTLVESQLKYPRHPDQGRASAVWRGDLWTSVGTGAHRYNRATIAPAGLDRDDGLPLEYTGLIIDFEPSYNALYALVSSEAVFPADSTDPTILHAGDDYMTYEGPSVTTTLFRWNGFGWHYVANTFGTAATTVIVSDADDDYGVWWAAYNQVWRIRLTRPYMNIKDDTTGPVVPDSFFETAWYNFGWEGQTKILKNFDMYIEAPGYTQTVDIFYKLDGDANPYVHLGTANTTTLEGETNLYFGLDATAAPGSSNPNDYHGLSCNRVKFRFELHQGSPVGTPSDKPVIRWFTVTARKMLRPVRTFRLMLNLDVINGYVSQEQRQKLLTIIRTPRAVDFVWQNETLKAEVVALSFRSTTDATNIVYTAKINVIEAFESLPEAAS